MSVTDQLANKAATHPAPAGEVLVPRPMESAPKDGTLLRLLVAFTNHAIEDSIGPVWTIGSNSFDNHGDDDEWKFAGWSWEQDCYTQGEGTPIGWLPWDSDVLTELAAACKERDEAKAAWSSLEGAARQYPGPEYKRARAADVRYAAVLAAALNR